MVSATTGQPSRVIYHAVIAYAAIHNEPKNPFSTSLADFTNDLNINTTSAYAAAQEATLGFEQLPDTTARTFIYTGNIMNNNFVIDTITTLGVGKSATAHLIQAAAAVYADKGFK